MSLWLFGVVALYGDVYAQPHDYNKWKRQLLADQQAAAGGGF
ncbi:hypothetical protein [Nocardioides taihuensis]|uniref:Uncharacterized protein n=1 Tax=Nocardioides taihuensis TaxID=1835606 RepID=A0ABW0BK43_9ACTN